MAVDKQQFKCDDLIVGAGMQGIMAARACISEGRDCIVIDKGKGVGGILQPQAVEDVSIDSGCHIWGAHEALNIAFIEDELGIQMIPVNGHCEISASPDGSIRRKLSVPSFEDLSDEVRSETIQRAKEMDPDVISREPIGTTFPKALGSHVSNIMLSIAQRMYGRDPGDLTMGAAAQMGISRIKLHTCEELKSCTEDTADFDPLLCSHPLDDKSDTFVKYRYPTGGLQALTESCTAWLREQAQELVLAVSPKSIEFRPGSPGGRVDTGAYAIDFNRLMWCCNPLALGLLVECPLPPKVSTAGSPFSVFFFEIRDGDCRVEYSHDFRLDSPMFRSWIPPAEMITADSTRRFAIVECPHSSKTEDTIEAVRNEVACLHGIDRLDLNFIGLRPQVRFFPTVTYLNWLQALSAVLEDRGGSVLIPGTPLYGKDVITDWWTKAVALS